MTDVQFITHYNERYSYLDSARVALEGGCRWIQLRMKDAPVEEVRETAVKVREMCSEYGARFIIDDHVILVAETGADGVHLGKSDMPVSEARKILGPSYIIGGTANTFDDVCFQVESGVDYLGIGPYRFTSTKKNLSPVLGIDGYRKIIAAMNARNMSVPVYAIGGIEYDDIPEIMRTGVCGIALSGTVLRSCDPVAEMARIISLDI